jgi:hypothetical protein
MKFKEHEKRMIRRVLESHAPAVVVRVGLPGSREQ